MKLTKAQYAQFKKIVTIHTKRWIPSYRLYFEFKKLDDNNWAECGWNCEGHNATFVLNSEPDEEVQHVNLERTAKHEVAHLILAKLDNLARSRYTNREQISEAVEELCRIFEQLL